MRTITSPVKRFPGTVTLPDYLTFPQAITWEKAIDEANALRDPVLDNEGNPARDKNGRVIRVTKSGVTEAEYLNVWTPALLSVVQAWSLDGFSVEPFQATPRAALISLFSWLIGEITALYDDSEDIPNA